MDGLEEIGVKELVLDFSKNNNINTNENGNIENDGNNIIVYGRVNNNGDLVVNLKKDEVVDKRDIEINIKGKKVIIKKEFEILNKLAEFYRDEVDNIVKMDLRNHQFESHNLNIFDKGICYIESGKNEIYDSVIVNMQDFEYGVDRNDMYYNYGYEMEIPYGYCKVYPVGKNYLLDYKEEIGIVEVEEEPSEYGITFCNYEFSQNDEGIIIYNNRVHILERTHRDYYFVKNDTNGISIVYDIREDIFKNLEYGEETIYYDNIKFRYCEVVKVFNDIEESESDILNRFKCHPNWIRNHETEFINDGKKAFYFDIKDAYKRNLYYFEYNDYEELHEKIIDECAHSESNEAQILFIDDVTGLFFFGNKHQFLNGVWNYHVLHEDCISRGKIYFIMLYSNLLETENYNFIEQSFYILPAKVQECIALNTTLTNEIYNDGSNVRMQKRKSLMPVFLLDLSSVNGEYKLSNKSYKVDKKMVINPESDFIGYHKLELEPNYTDEMYCIGKFEFANEEFEETSDFNDIDVYNNEFIINDLDRDMSYIWVFKSSLYSSGLNRYFIVFYRNEGKREQINFVTGGYNIEKYIEFEVDSDYLNIIDNPSEINPNRNVKLTYEEQFRRNELDNMKVVKTEINIADIEVFLNEEEKIDMRDAYYILKKSVIENV